MKITGNIFANNYWLMKFAPLALALAAAVIFFCTLCAHIWNGVIVYLPLLFLSLTGNKLVKILGGLFLPYHFSSEYSVLFGAWISD